MLISLWLWLWQKTRYKIGPWVIKHWFDYEWTLTCFYFYFIQDLRDWTSTIYQLSKKRQMPKLIGIITRMRDYQRRRQKFLPKVFLHCQVIFHLSLTISRSAHRTPNFTNPEYFVCLLFEYFFQIKVLNWYQNTPKNDNIWY